MQTIKTMRRVALAAIAGLALTVAGYATTGPESASAARYCVLAPPCVQTLYLVPY